MTVEGITYLINNVGLPITLLIVLGYAVRAVWLFSKPAIRRIVDAMVHFFDTLRENDSKHAENTAAINVTLREATTGVQAKVAEVHQDVKAVRDDVSIIRQWTQQQQCPTDVKGE